MNSHAQLEEVDRSALKTSTTKDHAADKKETIATRGRRGRKRQAFEEEQRHTIGGTYFHKIINLKF